MSEHLHLHLFIQYYNCDAHIISMIDSEWPWEPWEPMTHVIPFNWPIAITQAGGIVPQSHRGHGPLSAAPRRFRVRTSNFGIKPGGRNSGE